MKVSRKDIVSKDSNGNEVAFSVIMPSPEVKAKAEVAYNEGFRKAIEAKAFLNIQVERELENRGIWNEEKTKALRNTWQEIHDLELKLSKQKLKLEEAKQVAFALIKKRREQLELMSEKNELSSITAESKARDEEFNYILSMCTVDSKKGLPLFKDYKEYLKAVDEPYMQEAATALQEMLYNTDDYYNNLIEYKFLRKFKLVDDKNRLINEDGHLVNMDGKLINDKGQFVNKEGKVVDVDGNLIEEVPENPDFENIVI